MKAQGMPISVIIIAALGILVLVVLGAIFGGQIGKFGRVANECPNRCAPLPGGGYVEATNLQQQMSAMQQVKCLPGETKLSGLYIRPGQAGVEPENLEYCAACCAPIG